VKRVVLALFVVGLIAVPTAEAKFRIRMVLSDGSPAVGEAVDVKVHTNPVLEERFTLRLVAIPPRVGLYRALAHEDRYAVRLRREGRGWRATVRFARPGSWRLVVPNWGAPGYAIPPPVVRVVRVTPS
jgi:hypothetical protein